jgi:undecaprenyl-diphosphatase
VEATQGPEKPRYAAASVTPRVEAFGWDVPLFHALNRDFGALIDVLVRFCHSPLSGVLGAVGLILWAVWKWRARSVPLILTAVLAVVATDVVGARVLKPMLARSRPCYTLPSGTVRQVVLAANAGSLPSLHAANWFAAVTPFALAAPAAAPVLFLLATLVGLSRVVAGVHWPSDVLLGALLGISMGLLSRLLVQTLQRRWRARAGAAASAGPAPLTGHQK